MDDGNVMLLSPVSYTEEAQDLAEQVPGNVTHIMATAVSPEHWVHVPKVLMRWPKATVWACPGVTETSALIGRVPGQRDVWADMIRTFMQNYGRAPDIRTIEDGSSPPELWGGQVSFARYASNPPAYQECAVLVKPRRAVVLSDMGFGLMDEAVMKQYPPPAAAMSTAAKVFGRVGCPIPTPMLLKDPRDGVVWRDRVLAWEGWERLLCCHLDPLVPDGREQFSRCFEWLDGQAAQPSK